jgi:hypothetical protein
LKKVEETQPQEEPKKVAVEEKPKEPMAEAVIEKVEPPPTEEKKPDTVVEAKPPEEKPAEVKPTETKAPFIPEARSAGFLNKQDMRGIGIVLDSKEGKVLMAQEDILYLAFKTADPVMIGDRFTVFRASEDVRHPITGQRIGKKIEILGNVKIIDRNENFYTAKVIEIFDAITKGDRIHPYMKERMEDQDKR